MNKSNEHTAHTDTMCHVNEGDERREWHAVAYTEDGKWDDWEGSMQPPDRNEVTCQAGNVSQR